MGWLPGPQERSKSTQDSLQIMTLKQNSSAAVHAHVEAAIKEIRSIVG